MAFQAGMLAPFTPSLRWQYLGWIRGVTKLPIVVKGITTGEDARRAVDAGATATTCSNYGGRTLDGAFATLSVLPRSWTQSVARFRCWSMAACVAAMS